jgi:hypothetical protein
MAPAGEPDAGRGAFAQHTPPKTEQFGGPASRLLIKLGCSLDQSAGFYKAAEILFMQADAGKSFDDPLQLK